MRINVKLLAIATAIEMALAVLALFGGPHGTLGAWPWALQLPGMLAILLVPGDGGFAWRAALVIAIQVSVWYAICSLIRRRIGRRPNE